MLAVRKTTLASKLKWGIPDVLVQSRTFISGIETYKAELADFIHISIATVLQTQFAYAFIPAVYVNMEIEDSSLPLLRKAM